jgi:hypothetical protein
LFFNSLIDFENQFSSQNVVILIFTKFSHKEFQKL